MSNRTLPLDDKLYRYLLELSVREPAPLAELRAETMIHPLAGMQISPEQGQLLQLLVRLLGAHRCIEIGVFTGYSSLAVALALPEDGFLLACDVSAEYTAVARRYWARAGVAHKIQLLLGPAQRTLTAHLEAGATSRYDFIFIDADKPGYIGYYELALQLLRPGGLIAADNVLWGGHVADPEDRSPDTEAIRGFNRQLRDDPRVDLSLVPIGDGLTLARKR
ncbi:MAG: class I SAM-dependent methyltransferase [Gammaproteobacteria bacterium]|nr:class I SAM-dependent methyltransferase [Gammaproteobacteria bacterium]